MSGWWIRFDCGHEFLLLTGWTLQVNLTEEPVAYCPYCNEPSRTLHWEED